VDCIPLLVERVRAAGVDAPALGGLAGVIAGNVEAATWTESLTAPAPVTARPRRARAA